MNKHTPGKWKVGNSGKQTGIIIWRGDEITNNNHKRIARNVSNETDANLIASAPELLEALKYMVKWAERHGLTTGELITGQQATLPVIDMARKAIAKVEGE